MKQLALIIMLALGTAQLQAQDTTPIVAPAATPALHFGYFSYQGLFESMPDYALAKRNIDAHVTTVGCIGMCVREPLVDIEQAGQPRVTYGNVKPVDEYKRAGFDMFDEMVNGIQSETVRRLFTVRVRREQKLERKTVARGAATNAGGDDSEKKRPVRRVKKPGRNDPCPCGKLRPNGLPMKYKDCCGKNA